MRKVTREIRHAERDIKKGNKGKALKELKVAAKKNSKLADYDEHVRDPEIARYKKMKRKGC